MCFSTFQGAVLVNAYLVFRIALRVDPHVGLPGENNQFAISHVRLAAFTESPHY